MKKVMGTLSFILFAAPEVPHPKAVRTIEMMRIPAQQTKCKNIKFGYGNLIHITETNIGSTSISLPKTKFIVPGSQFQVMI